ncbi:MAG: NifU family protein [Gemmatimonadota bacterium]|nr:NifU family protein [Gemmatimonadota bacterium]
MRPPPPLCIYNSLNTATPRVYISALEAQAEPERDTMLEFTDTARDMVQQFADSMDDPKLRIAMHGSPFAPEYEFALVEEEPKDADRVVEMDGFRVLVDAESARRIEGSTVDWVSGEAGTGFEVRNPNVRKLGEAEPTGELADRVKHVLETRVNPGVASHGGHISLVDVDGADVYLELGGGCQGCGMARVTLKQGVERMLREAIPDIGEIHDVTDHAAGANPYYASP